MKMYASRKTHKLWKEVSFARKSAQMHLPFAKLFEFFGASVRNYGENFLKAWYISLAKLGASTFDIVVNNLF